MSREERSRLIYEKVHAAVLLALGNTTPMNGFQVLSRRAGEQYSIARAAANAAVIEDERAAQERLDVIRMNEGSLR